VTAEKPNCDEEYDFTGKYLSPGFIDLHTHGAGGYAFADSDPQEVAKGCDFHLAHGTLTLLPTVSASAFQAMEHSLANIHTAKTEHLTKANIVGAHLEGPYLALSQCGAQCPDYITPPIREEYEQLVKKYGSSIARWTYAPEYDTDGTFCRYITGHGILASVGHSDAKYDDICRAIENGCSLVTHLYSCTSTVTRNKGFRSLGVIESAYLRDELFVEIIADGKHLPPELINMILKVKGREQVALITDSLPVAGSEEKEGVLCGTPFIIEEGVARLPDRSAFVGSIATADALIRVLTRQCGEDLVSAVGMLTRIPARILSLSKGQIAPGLDADLIVFDEDIQVSDAFIGGEKIF